MGVWYLWKENKAICYHQRPFRRKIDRRKHYRYLALWRPWCKSVLPCSTDFDRGIVDPVWRPLGIGIDSFWSPIYLLCFDSRGDHVPCHFCCKTRSRISWTCFCYAPTAILLLLLLFLGLPVVALGVVAEKNSCDHCQWFQTWCLVGPLLLLWATQNGEQTNCVPLGIGNWSQSSRSRYEKRTNVGDSLALFGDLG